jgi:dynein heavy chain
MRALRDFNIPKIITEDIPIFMGLVGDLFPAMDVPRKRNVRFEEAIKKAAIDLKLQPEDGFILKVYICCDSLQAMQPWTMDTKMTKY